MTFGDNLKTLRNSRSVSQKTLADELGFSFQNVSKWERNESLPDIETLLAIARYFGTTTDALLGHTTKEQFSTLKISDEEVKVYDSYPEAEEIVSRNIILVIDDKGRIAATFQGRRNTPYKTGYYREGAEVTDENSTVIFEHSYKLYGRGNPNGGRPVTVRKKLRIFEGGFLVALPSRSFVEKKIMHFIIPEDYKAWLDEKLYPEEYYDGKRGLFLLGDIVRHGELDIVTVERTKDGVLFKKPCEAVDPMAVNIETLAKIVRKELEKEHDKNIAELKKEIEELSDTVGELEGRIDGLEGQISDLEGQIEELESDEV